MPGQPKKTKYLKQHKGRNRGKATRGNKISFGEFGILAKKLCNITARQIEAARRAINRYLERKGKIIIRIFPDKPITKKPLEVRQGKGKGSVDHYVAQVKPGTVLYEIEGVDEETARAALKKGAAKLPVACATVKRTVL